MQVPWTDNPVSRKGAKRAKFAKKNTDSGFAFLCALASWRELFDACARSQPTSRRLVTCHRSFITAVTGSPFWRCGYRSRCRAAAW
jgi:hypothetical protein